MLARIDRAVWPIAGLVWLYEALHDADHLGINSRAVWQGPHDLLHGIALYPDTSNFGAFHAALHQAFYVFPPASAIILAPFRVVGRTSAGALFVLLSAFVFAGGLYMLAPRTPFPALIVLGVPGLIGIGAAVLLNLAGFALIRAPGRFFHDVVPFLAKGQQHIAGCARRCPTSAPR